MDLHLNCSECGQKLVVDSSAGGEFVPCPTCNRQVYIPKPTFMKWLASRSNKFWILTAIATFIICLICKIIVISINAKLSALCIVFMLPIYTIEIGIIASAYFLPTVIGFKNRNVLAIFILNLFLGWTVLGWIAALIWSVLKPTVPKESIQHKNRITVLILASRRNLIFTIFIFALVATILLVVGLFLVGLFLVGLIMLNSPPST